MHKGESIDCFLTRFHEVWDQLSVVGEAPQPTELVRLALSSVLDDSHMFLQSILGRDTFPKWDRMWFDLQKEELRRALVKITISDNSKDMKGEKEE